MSRTTRSRPARLGLPLAASLALLSGAALAQAPTIGDLARQSQQPPAQQGAQQAAPAQPRPAAPGAALPTIGEMARQATQGPAPAGAAQGAAPAPGPAPDGCERPELPPPPPKGATATAAEMQAANAQVREYVKQSEAFNACLDRLVRENFRRLRVDEYLVITRQYDHTITLMEVVAGRYNEQLRVFRAKKP